MRNFRSCILFASLWLGGCGTQPPDAASSQTTQSKQVRASPRSAARTVAVRVAAGGGVWRVYGLPDLAELWTSTARLPAVDRVIGLDPEQDLIYVLTKKDELLAADLVGGRIDTVSVDVSLATLGADGTLYAVDSKHRVVSLKRRTRFAWPQPLPAPPRDLFPATDQRLVAVVAGDRPRLLTAGADQPPAEHDLPFSGDAAAARYGDLVVVASDSGVAMLDPLGRRRADFVRLPDHPRAVAFSPSGHRVYVARRGAPGLAAIDRYAREEMDGVALPGPAATLRLDPLGRWLLARPAVGDSAWVVDLPTKQLRGTTATAWGTDLPALAPDGSLLVRRGSDVVALTPDSLKERGRAEGAGGDLWIASAWRPRNLPASAAATTAAEETAEGGPLYVQVSVSQNQAWAAENAQQLTRAGMPARVLPPSAPEDGYRVVIGPYATRELAEAIGRKLGRPYWIYQPGAEATP